MIDPELKKKWVDALRSGEYKQTKECLRNDDGFCCLGVLADIKGVEWLREYGNDIGEETFVFYDDDVFGEPRQYDVVSPESWVPRNLMNILMGMNDGDAFQGTEQHSFEEIADFIENSVDI